jgi:hypothetical protein
MKICRFRNLWSFEFTTLLTHCSFLSLQIKERTLSINAVSVTKTETLLPLDPIVFTPTTFRHTKRLPIRISRPSHKKFHFKKFHFKKIIESHLYYLSCVGWRLQFSLHFDHGFDVIFSDLRLVWTSF